MLKQLPLAISPDRNATFENFYVADANHVAVTALQQYPLQDDELFFYLWGESGSGITHLLEAVQNAADTLSIQYLPLAELVTYSPEEIIEGMEQLDLICIDDIDVISGNPQWEEAIFHLFNRCRNSQSRLLIGSHQSPRNLPLNLADLQSRLQWGTVFHIQSLNDNYKQQAIQFRAQRLGMELSDDVANYLLQRVGRSSTELFDLIKRLDHASLSEQRKLTIPFVKKILSL